MTRNVSIDVVRRAEALLGEGPLWDQDRHELLWMDIARAEVHRLQPQANTDVVVTKGRVTGAVAVSRHGGLVAAAEDGFWRIEAEGIDELIAEVEADDSGTRINDAKCDAAGRFWAGTISLDLRAGGGSLYFLDTDGVVRRALGDLTVPNGLGFSPDGRTLYFIDSYSYGVDAYPFDPDDAKLGAPRRIVDIPPTRGLADGMTIDAEGALWVALFGGSCVQQYGPEGTVGITIDLPVTHPTSCTFGDEGLDTMYITSARSDENGPMAEDALASQPLAGAIFACHPGTTGLPADRCAC